MSKETNSEVPVPDRKAVKSENILNLVFHQGFRYDNHEMVVAYGPSGGVTIETEGDRICISLNSFLSLAEVAEEVKRQGFGA